jgi:hypothetical protein
MGANGSSASEGYGLSLFQTRPLTNQHAPALLGLTCTAVSHAFTPAPSLFTCVGDHALHPLQHPKAQPSAQCGSEAIFWYFDSATAWRGCRPIAAGNADLGL